MKLLSSHRCFQGEQRRYCLASKQLNSITNVGVYLPPNALGIDRQVVPALIWLSGLTCTDENAVLKSGAQRKAAELGLALITPDTSPRGDDVPTDPDGHWDFGHGAGYYLDALREPWTTHYRMNSFLVDELFSLLSAELPIDVLRLGLSGHSMGGHGALVLGLRQPECFLSISAVSPIAHPSACPWGRKAFSFLLGDTPAAQAHWRQWDTVALLEDGHRRSESLLVDVGLADPYLEEQLRPEDLRIAAAENGQPLDLVLHDGYDHSYFFVASMMDRHLEHHARAMKLIV
jgi:S-formylglutathione hydrolase